LSPRVIRGLLYAALVLLLALHNDFWQWDDPTLVLGLPIGFAYHIGYCVAASILMLLFVKLAWPTHLEVADDEEDK
jgi:hypothetical protein